MFGSSVHDCIPALTRAIAYTQTPAPSTWPPAYPTASNRGAAVSRRHLTEVQQSATLRWNWPTRRRRARRCWSTPIQWARSPVRRRTASLAFNSTYGLPMSTRTMPNHSSACSFCIHIRDSTQLHNIPLQRTTEVPFRHPLLKLQAVFGPPFFCIVDFHRKGLGCARITNQKNAGTVNSRIYLRQATIENCVTRRSRCRTGAIAPACGTIPQAAV